jgi:hypothetical protein
LLINFRTTASLATLWSLALIALFASVPGNAGAGAAQSIAINALPATSIEGQPVVIYGRLSSRARGQEVTLYSHLHSARPHAKPFYLPVARTRSGRSGYYAFRLPAGIVTSNRLWKVIVAKLVSSVALHQGVMPEATLTASSSATDTASPVLLSGTVTPAESQNQVLIQSQVGSNGSAWHTLVTVRLDRQSRFQLRQPFSLPGTYELRALIAPTSANVETVTDVVTEVVQQAQDPDFTIAPSSSVVSPGQTATITGNVFQPNSSVPEADAVVNLWAHVHGSPYVKLAQTTTDASGHYSFRTAPTQTETYEVRAAPQGSRHSAQAVIGVQSSVTISASSRSWVGRKLTVSGNVGPGAVGNQVILQMLGPHAAWVAVANGVVQSNSTYRIEYTIGARGKDVFRVLLPGGPSFVSAHSAAAAVRVAVPAVRALP